MPFGFGIGIVNTDQIADGAVTNAKVNASAAIVQTKLDISAHTNLDEMTSATSAHGHFLSISMVLGG